YQLDVYGPHDRTHRTRTSSGLQGVITRMGCPEWTPNHERRPMHRLYLRHHGHERLPKSPQVGPEAFVLSTTGDYELSGGTSSCQIHRRQPRAYAPRRPCGRRHRFLQSISLSTIASVADALATSLQTGFRRRRPIDHGLYGRMIEWAALSLFTVGMIA